MELGVSKLELSKATAPIPDYNKGNDPLKGIQIHDYKNVSFIRMDPRARAASQKTIEMLGAYYPETLSRKFFVNVPIVMQWMFSAMKLIISRETTKKFSVLSHGTGVAAELGSGVPSEYGGKAEQLEYIGEQTQLK
jgi:phosphatidylinositol transfer protein SFH5